MEEHLKISYTDETLIAALSGEIDHHRAVSVRTGIDEAMYRELPKTLVIDIGASILWTAPDSASFSGGTQRPRKSARRSS